MKKALVFLAVLGFLSGCGSRQQASDESSGTTSRQKDYINEGIKDLKNANIKDAIKSFDMAIRQNPSDPKAYIVLGETYIRLNRYDRAIDTFTAATRVAPTDGQLYYLLAVSYGLSGDAEQAKINAQKSIVLFQRDKDVESLKKSVALLAGMQKAQ